MIRRTFIILPTIGPATERSIWRQGIIDWDDFLNEKDLVGISHRRKIALDQHLERAMNFLDRGESWYFDRILPSCEHWRLFQELKEDVAYLDIESDGLGAHARVTMVGIYRDGETRTLVRGQNLSGEAISQELEGSRLLVTFNGGSFDLPLLEYNFPFAMPRLPHFDLRHGCARIGLKGGLKSIERRLGIYRPMDIDFVTGEEAVYLWKLWERRKNSNALKLLKKYNEQDIRNLEPLAEFTYERLERSMETRKERDE